MAMKIFLKHERTAFGCTVGSLTGVIFYFGLLWSLADLIKYLVYKESYWGKQLDCKDEHKTGDNHYLLVICSIGQLVQIGFLCSNILYIFLQALALIGYHARRPGFFMPLLILWALWSILLLFLAVADFVMVDNIITVIFQINEPKDYNFYLFMILIGIWCYSYFVVLSHRHNLLEERRQHHNANAAELQHF